MPCSTIPIGRATSALIDEACGLTGNNIAIGEGPKEDIQVNFVGLYYRGQRRTDQERLYLEVYHPINEGVPRLRQLPYNRLVQIKDLYTSEELKTSPAFNEPLLWGNYQNGLSVRMGGMDGSYMTWSLGDPADRQGWESSQITMVRRLVPHIRQFVRVRQSLVRAQAFETTATALLDDHRVGVIHLDRRGQVLAANDRARHILLRGDVLSDRDGVLRTRAPEDQPRLDRLVAAALPADGGVAVGGSMSLRSSAELLPLVVHIKPMGVPQLYYGGRYAAALVLFVEPGCRQSIDPDLVAEALGLTPGESQVAVWLAEGRSVNEIARSTGHSTSAIYWHLQQTYQKLHISRQVDLVRLVLSVAGLG